MSKSTSNSRLSSSLSGTAADESIGVTPAITSTITTFENTGNNNKKLVQGNDRDTTDDDTITRRLGEEQIVAFIMKRYVERIKNEFRRFSSTTATPTPTTTTTSSLPIFNDIKTKKNDTNNVVPLPLPLFFTNYEYDTFSRYTYYGYKYGIIAGLCTFGCFYGSIRYMAYRTYIKEGIMLLPTTSTTHHSNMIHKRQYYNQFDNNKVKMNQIKTTTVKKNQHHQPQQQQQTGSSSSSSSSSLQSNATTTSLQSSSSPTATIVNSNNNNSSHTKTIVTLFTSNNNVASFAIFPSNDSITTVQLYISMAIGLFVSVMTWNYYFDWDQLHEDIAAIPLQSGITSSYCSTLCNELLTLVVHNNHHNNNNSNTNQKNQFMNHRISVPIPTTTTSNNNTISNEKSHNQQQQQQQQEVEVVDNMKVYTVKELWDDPITDNLHRMVRLVQNCEQRKNYIRQEKQKLMMMEHNRYSVTDSTNIQEQSQNQRQQQQQQQQQQQANMIVVIPEPSLPLQYHSVPKSYRSNISNNQKQF